MANLITLKQARHQLRIVDDEDDEYLEEVLIPNASDIIVDYLKTKLARSYDINASRKSKQHPPRRVQQATLAVLADLYEDREGATDPIGPAVESILERDRDPTLV